MEFKEIKREEFERQVRAFYSDLIDNENYKKDLGYNTLLSWARLLSEKMILNGWEKIQPKKEPAKSD